MERGSTRALYGAGRGKSDAAIGRAIQAASLGEEVVIIQFLKEKNEALQDMMKRLEPEIKYFRFEKKNQRYEDLSAEEQQEEKMNIRNGINFARKVLATGECKILVLDEALGLVDCKAIEWEELEAILKAKPDETELILTGRELDPRAREYVDVVSHIETR